jgi:hypothetical protein
MTFRTDADYTNTVTLAAAVLALWRYENGKTLSGGNTLSSVAQLEYLKLHPDLPQSVKATHRFRSLMRSHGIVAMCHYILTKLDASEAEAFFDKLATGEDLKKGDPVLALRNRFANAGNQRFHANDIAYLIFKAWNAVREGRTMAQISIPEGSRLPKPY